MSDLDRKPPWPIIALLASVATAGAIALGQLTPPFNEGDAPVPPTPTQTTSHGSAPQDPPPPATPRTSATDGLWTVGTELKPGKWAAYPSPACMWVVRADNTPEGYISGGTGARPDLLRAVYTTLSAGWTFETVGCGAWIWVGDR